MGHDGLVDAQVIVVAAQTLVAGLGRGVTFCADLAGQGFEIGIEGGGVSILEPGREIRLVIPNVASQTTLVAKQAEVRRMGKMVRGLQAVLGLVGLPVDDKLSAWLCAVSLRGGPSVPPTCPLRARRP